MAQAFGEIASDLEQLSERVHELERRVAALEGHPKKPASSQPEAAGESLQPAATWLEPSGGVPSGAVPVLGKAVLGIAGAYLLRALAESATLPKLPILLVAVVYAGWWMVWAVRSHASNRFAGIIYAFTSALILSPLLWESSVRFQVLPPAFAAVVLVAFVVLAVALTWQRNLQVIPWIATLAAVITAMVLIIGTHAVVPLTLALLSVALVAEISACLGHRLTLRAFPAIAADFAVWLLIDVMTSPGGVPEDYHPANPATIMLLCLALLVIYGGSIAIRSFGLRHRITAFEMGQGVLAFALAAFGVMRASHGSGAPWLGALCLLLAAVCYWGTLSRFAEEGYVRNRRVTATWAGALLLAGSLLLLPTYLQAPFLCLAAVGAAFVYTRTRKLALGMHASVYLAAATAISPLPSYAGSALAGTVPSSVPWNVWIVAASAVLCYAIGSRVTEDKSRRRLLWVVPAGLVGLAAAALAVVAIVALAAGRAQLDASHLSVIRTVVNCALALTLGYLGSRWKHIELGWLAYASVAFGTLKLVLEDLRFGNAASLVVSLLFYGLILIMLPRLTRRSGSDP